MPQAEHLAILVALTLAVAVLGASLSPRPALYGPDVLAVAAEAFACIGLLCRDDLADY